jgi:hypothetical protein
MTADAIGRRGFLLGCSTAALGAALLGDAGTARSCGASTKASTRAST